MIHYSCKVALLMSHLICDMGYIEIVKLTKQDTQYDFLAFLKKKTATVINLSVLCS